MPEFGLAFPPLSILDIVGLVGVGLYVAAYSGVQTGQVDGNGLLYTALNGLAAACILISMTGAFNLAGALVNGIFLCVSLLGAARVLGRRVQRPLPGPVRAGARAPLPPAE